MVSVIENAVLDRQRMPRSVRLVPYDRGTVRLEPSLLRAAQRRAWGSRLPHNRARSHLPPDGDQRTGPAGCRAARGEATGTGSGATRPRRDPQGPGRRSADPAGPVRPVAGARPRSRLVSELFSSRRLDATAGIFAPISETCCAAAAMHPLTGADVPLIDEAAELLGEVTAGDARAAAEAAAELAYATRHWRPSSPAPGQTDGGIDFTVGMLSPADLAAPACRWILRRPVRGAGPGVDLRPRHRRRGAGTVPDGLADGDAPVPVEVHDGGRRRRADQRPRRLDVVGAGTEPARPGRWRLPS